MNRNDHRVLWMVGVWWVAWMLVLPCVVWLAVN